jgi:hypothetical protein
MFRFWVLGLGFLLQTIHSAELGGHWTHLTPAAFDHTTLPSWTNQACIYEWAPAARVRPPPTPPTPTRTNSTTPTSTAHYTFTSPETCLDDQWKATPATIFTHPNPDGSNGLEFTFVLHNTTTGKQKTITVTGSTSNDTDGIACTFVDMSDGGLYIRTTTHPFFMPPHEWIRVAAGWLLRAAYSARV